MVWHTERGGRQRGGRAVLVVMVALQIGFGSTLAWAH